jgi:hypothetical protein
VPQTASGPVFTAMSGNGRCRQRWLGCFWPHSPGHIHQSSSKIIPPLRAASQISETTKGTS